MSTAMNTAIPAKVLVVDDEPAVRDAVERVLRVEGFAVETAIDGRDAIRRVAETRPDAMLLDILMPGLDGLEVCRRMRDTGRQDPGPDADRARRRLRPRRGPRSGRRRLPAQAVRTRRAAGPRARAAAPQRLGRRPPAAALRRPRARSRVDGGPPRRPHSSS